MKYNTLVVLTVFQSLLFASSICHQTASRSVRETLVGSKHSFSIFNWWLQQNVTCCFGFSNSVSSAAEFNCFYMRFELFTAVEMWILNLSIPYCIWWSVVLQPRPGLGLPLRVSWEFYSTMWGYQLHDRPILDTLIQPSETSSSKYQRLAAKQGNTCEKWPLNFADKHLSCS
jgi:hypothetical protein